ncbi:alcohol dehydrogenase catalytic domain-containing protein [Streptomyces microflavus]|uniref:alcohol dehydrogenase catalytic domain-containing protein n=1 Tax=Streptomyces microflavus TaxID=1919 RepID=UPI003319403F
MPSRATTTAGRATRGSDPLRGPARTALFTDAGPRRAGWRGEVAGSVFPLVPGYEMTGEITAVSSAVTGFRVGDQVAVGSIIDSGGVRPPCDRRHRGHGRARPNRAKIAHHLGAEVVQFTRTADKADSARSA